MKDELFLALALALYLVTLVVLAVAGGWPVPGQVPAAHEPSTMG